jgi:excisionase family DNA binding protein
MSALSTEPSAEMAPKDEPRAVLCTTEAAELLGISRWLLLQEIKRGNIPHKRVGRRIVLSRQRLLEWLTDEA